MEDLKVRIKIDSNTQELVRTRKEVSNLGKSFLNVDAFASNFINKLNIGAGIYLGYQLFNQTLADVYRTGMKVNKEMQVLTGSLATMNAVTSQNVDSMGNQLTVTQKYALANVEAKKTLQDLLEINSLTPHNFNQTVKLYDSMYVGMKKVGATSEDMVEITKKLSIAVGNKVGFDAMLSAMDGLSTGTVEANSEMGRFLSAIGLTNEEIKGSADVVQLFKDKLSEFKAIENFNTKLSNLNNSWSILSANLTKPIFSIIEENLKPMSDFIDTMNRGAIKVRVDFSNISELDTKTDLILKRKLLLAERKEIKNDKYMWDSEQKRLTSDIDKKLLELSTKLAEIFKEGDTKGSLVPSFDSKEIDDLINKTLYPYATGIKEINKEWEKHFKDFSTNGKDTSLLVKAWTKEIEAYDKKFAKKNKPNKPPKSKQKSVISTNLSSWQAYYEKIGNYEVSWGIKSSMLRTQYIDLNESQFTVMERAAKKEYFDKIHKEQQKLNDFTIDVKFEGFNDISNSFADIGNSMIEMIERSEDFAKLQKVNSKEIMKYNSNQVGSYGDITGAIKGFTKEGSNEYKTFEKIQRAMYMGEMAMNVSRLASQAAFTSSFLGFKTAEATAAGTVAVVSQGAGDPYTAFARMAAMAALVASLGIAVSGAFGGNKTKVTEDKDAVAAMAESLGTGRLLGSDEASESVKNSLDILEDYAKPEFQVLSQMANSLQSIDNKMGGLSNLIIRGETFALGKNYSGAYTDNFGLGVSFSKQATKVSDKLEKMLSAGGDILAPLSTAGLKLTDKLIGGILNGVFGKTSVSRNLSNSGLLFSPQTITDAIADINGQNFQTVATTVNKKSWFRSSSHTSYNTYFQALEEETERQFELVLGTLYDTVLVSGKALDTSRQSIEKDLSDFIVNIGKISLKGKSGEDIQKQLSNIFSAIGDDLALDAFPELAKFQKIGEGVFETLTRVSTGMEVAEYYINRLGNQYEDIKYTDIKNKEADVGIEVLTQSIKKYDEAIYGLNNGVLKIVDTFNGSTEELFETYSNLEKIRLNLTYTNQNAANLNSDFIVGAGSIKSLDDGINDYIENFLSIAEKNNHLTATVRKEFSKLNLALPGSNEEFRNLVEGLDTSTKAGAELYGRLIILSDEFANLSEKLEDTKTKSKEFIEAQEAKLLKLSENTMNSFINGLDKVASLSKGLNNQALDAISRMNISSGTTTDKIMMFNKLQGEFDSYFQNGVLKAGLDQEEVNNKYNKIIELTSSIAGEDKTLIPSLTAALNENMNKFDATDKTIKVNIVDGLAELINASMAQKLSLSQIVSDGVITNTELNSMANISEASKAAILTVANNSSYLSTEETSSSMAEFSRLQLEAIVRQNEDKTEHLSAKTLNYGDTIGLQEQIDLAKVFEMDFESVKPLIDELQKLSIVKDVNDSLYKMLNVTDNKLSYDKDKFDQISLLKPYLSEKINNSLDGLASESQFNNSVLLAFNQARQSLNNETYNSLQKYNKESDESSKALNLFNAVPILKLGNYYERAEDLLKNQAFRKGGYASAWTTTNSSTRLWNTKTNTQRYNNTALNNSRYSSYLKEFSEKVASYNRYVDLKKINDMQINQNAVLGNDKAKELLDQFSKSNKSNEKVVELLNDLIEITAQGGEATVGVKKALDEMNNKNQEIA